MPDIADLNFDLDGGGLHCTAPPVLSQLESYLAVHAENALSQALKPPFGSLSTNPTAAATNASLPL